LRLIRATAIFGILRQLIDLADRSCEPTKDVRNYEMKINRADIIKATLLGSLILCGFFCLSLWNKSDFCAGWAAHYAERAAVLRDERSRAIAEDRNDDARLIERTAMEMNVIAKKYARVASNPLLPYPSKPLVTEADLASEQASSRKSE
jgi:hypothetical protein